MNDSQAPRAIVDEHRAVGEDLEVPPVAVGEPEGKAHDIGRHGQDRVYARGRRRVEQAPCTSHARNVGGAGHGAPASRADLDDRGGAA